jgi:type IV secretory pathway component VirB8
MSAPRPLVEYFEQAASWDADRNAQAARSERIAWRVALAA